MGLDAWLLHKAPSGDTSLKLHLFTREKGIIICWYRGGRTPKKQAALQPFTPLWVSLDLKQNAAYLKQLEPRALSLDLKKEALFSAYYLNELLYYGLKPLDCHMALYDAYEYALQGLTIVQERPALEALLRKFEWLLLAACGYGFSFIVSPESKETSTQRRYQYSPGKGFKLAGQGILEAEAQAITAGEFSQLGVLKAAKPVMRQAIDHFLEGRVLHSRGFFKSYETSS